jgi:hypothetical protein
MATLGDDGLLDMPLRVQSKWDDSEWHWEDRESSSDSDEDFNWRR